MGAGASLANAQHFRPERNQRSHPPLDTTFFEKVYALDAQLEPSLRQYVRRLIGADPSPRTLDALRMEEFFKDIYYDFRRSRSAVERHAYIALVRLYTRVLRETTNWLCADGRQGGPVGRLISAASEQAAVVDIVTFNHDLVIENEIFKRARLRRRWCIERGYGGVAEGMTLLRSRTGTDFPALTSECAHTHPISVLKLHGSLNWVVRLQGVNPTVKQLLGEAKNQAVLLSRRREIIGRLRYTRRGAKGRSSWNTWPLIIPPVYAKEPFISTVERAWDEAREALATCDRVVFFGYSLPAADIEAEKLFQRGVAANPNLEMVDVINRDPAAASRYAALLRRKGLAWHPSPELFLTADGFR